MTGTNRPYPLPTEWYAQWWPETTSKCSRGRPSQEGLAVGQGVKI